MATTFDQVANRAEDALSSGMAPGDLTAALTAIGEFPLAFPFYLTIDNEIIRVDSLSAGTTYNVTRAQQGTSAASHSSGATVSLHVTAGTIQTIQTALGTLEDDAVLLDGRSGGQTVAGGTAANDDLTLRANSVGGSIAAADTDWININDRIKFFAGGVTLSNGDPVGLMSMTDTITCGGNSVAIRVLTFTPIIDYQTFNQGVVQLFNAAPTIQDSNGITSNNGFVLFRAAPIFNWADVVHSGQPTTTLYSASTTYKTFTVGSMTVPAHTGYQSSLVGGAGNTITVARHFYAAAGSGAGTITTQVALEIEDFALGTTKLSVRSAGATVEMRHAGPGVFGANAAPTNASVGLEVQSTTKAFLLPRLTNAQIVTLTGVAVADGMLVYCTDAGALPIGAHQRLGGAWVAM